MGKCDNKSLPIVRFGVILGSAQLEGDSPCNYLGFLWQVIVPRCYLHCHTFHIYEWLRWAFNYPTLDTLVHLIGFQSCCCFLGAKSWNLWLKCTHTQVKQWISSFFRPSLSGVKSFQPSMSQNLEPKYCVDNKGDKLWPILKFTFTFNSFLHFIIRASELLLNIPPLSAHILFEKSLEAKYVL